LEDLGEFYQNLELKASSSHVHCLDTGIHPFNFLSAKKRTSQVEVEGLLHEGAGRKSFRASLADGRKLVITTIENRADLTQAEDLLREGYIHSIIEHPHIFPVYDFGIDEDFGPYLAMPYLEGLSLSELLQSKCSVEQLIAILQQVLEALSFAHSRDVFHGHVTSDNVFITSSGKVYLRGWGESVVFPSMDRNGSAEALLNQFPLSFAESYLHASAETDINQLEAIFSLFLNHFPIGLQHLYLKMMSQKIGQYTSVREVMESLRTLSLKSHSYKASIKGVLFASAALLVFTFGVFFLESSKSTEESGESHGVLTYFTKIVKLGAAEN
jgi:serine/threonine protein kinase